MDHQITFHIRNIIKLEISYKERGNDTGWDPLCVGRYWSKNQQREWTPLIESLSLPLTHDSTVNSARA